MDSLLTRKQLAEIFGVSTSTLDNWREWYNLPEVHLGGRTVRFIYEDVRRELEKHRG